MWSMWRACNLTAFVHSSTGPVVHPFASCLEGPEFNPQGVFMWNWDSPVSVDSLHWWPWPDWSLWPRLRWALSQTITRPSCRQCDNPTWSNTALLSRFHAHCRSSFRLHNWHSRLLRGEPCGEPAVSLHSYTVPLVQWSTRLLPVMRDPSSIPRGYLCETGILLLALSLYIGGPDLIDHCGLVWGGLCPKPSLGRHADNVIIPLDLIQLFCPGFMLTAGPPSGFTTDIVGCWGGSPVESLQSHCIHTQFHWSSGPPVCFPSWGTRIQSPGRYLCETRIILLVLSR
jgi:hypothetical protein